MKRELIKQSVVIFTILLAISAPNAFAWTKSNSSSDNDHMNIFKISISHTELDGGDSEDPYEPSTATFTYIRKLSKLESLSTNLVVSYAYLEDSPAAVEDGESSSLEPDRDLTGHKFSLGGQLQGNIGNIIPPYIGNRIAPYIGAGISFLEIERDDSVNKDRDSIEGYYLELGSNFYITERFGLVLDYNKFTGSDLVFAEKSVESDHDQISFGLLLKF